MKALLFAAGLTALAAAPAAASTAQTLGIVLRSNDAATERLPHYQASRPIAVHVAGEARRLSAVLLTAKGPDGTAIHTELARSGDAFVGDLRLATPGVWNVALTTQVGSVTAALADVPLDVVPPSGSEPMAYVTFALALTMFGCGTLLIVSRRPALAPVRRTNDWSTRRS